MNTYSISSISVLYLIGIILNGTIHHVMAMEEPFEDSAALTTSATQQLEGYNGHKDNMHEGVHYHQYHSPQPATYCTPSHLYQGIANERTYTNPPQRYAPQTYPGFVPSQQQPPTAPSGSSADVSQPQTRHLPVPLPTSLRVSLPPISIILDGLRQAETAVESSTNSAAVSMSRERRLPISASLYPPFRSNNAFHGYGQQESMTPSGGAHVGWSHGRYLPAPDGFQGNHPFAPNNANLAKGNCRAIIISHVFHVS